jgi:hypothetical protein
MESAGRDLQASGLYKGILSLGRRRRKKGRREGRPGRATSTPCFRAHASHLPQRRNTIFIASSRPSTRRIDCLASSACRSNYRLGCMVSFIRSDRFTHLLDVYSSRCSEVKFGELVIHTHHGATASSKSAVRISINTMVRLLHQYRSCGPCATVYNHGSTASSKSAMRSLQDHQPWLDRTTNVGYVELKSSTVLAVLDHLHGMLDSVLHL